MVLSHNWVARLRRFINRQSAEHCDLCHAEIAPRHAHMIELKTRRFFCACRQCVLTLGTSERFRVIESRVDVLDGFKLTDAEWEMLQVPIDMVFVFQSTFEKRPIAIYPSPAGATESRLNPEIWSRLLSANPSLANLQPDTEALLVNRTNGAREYYRVSIDRCYSLIGLIRTRWHGLSGGSEAWDAIAGFFARLREAALLPAEDMLHD
ncbi:MAG TPA: DUF5947 family protein [Methylocella sp.]|nr:DUF5947 family protein [Methylocella sp.]